MPDHKRIYDEVIISVPDEKDSLVKQVLREFELYGFDLARFKEYKHVLVNSGENASATADHFTKTVLENILGGIKDSFKILTGMVEKNSESTGWKGEAEFRVPVPWLNGFEEILSVKGIKYHVSDKPKYLDYA